ncbi:MFS transporter [Methanoplanus endosymbiosus]|uniref:MFS transporter n=1 Tax=Methanoplanus endosymbiosus TaxID=33865 RepID=A0A9E7PNH5_9EURY|nr:MFS transporter [Methanoplanus endosymbiosus]UUX93528.1 MFS transporter [Methanoplanus endosymbiosus]
MNKDENKLQNHNKKENENEICNQNNQRNFGVGLPKNPDKNRILLILSLCVFISLVGIGIVVPLFSVYADNLGASGLWIGIVFGAFAFSRTVFMPYFGSLSDRCDKKKIIASGLLLYAVISLGYIIAGDVLALVAVRLIHGISSAMIAPVAMAYLGEIAAPGEEAGFMAKFQAAILFGFGAGPLIGGYLYDLSGFKAAFYSLTLLSTLAFLVLVLFLPSEVKIRNEISGNVLSEDKYKGSEESAVKKSDAAGKSMISGHSGNSWLSRISGILSSEALKLLFKNPLYAGVLLVTFVTEFGMIGLLVFIPLYVPGIGLSPGAAGLIISLNVFSAGILQMIFGNIADRKGRRYLVPVGCLIMGVAFIAISFAGSLPFLLALSLLHAVGGLFVYPALNAYMVDAGRVAGMGAVMGIYNSVRGVGDMIAPVIGGIIIDIYGLGVYYHSSGVMVIISAVIFVLLSGKIVFPAKSR